MYNLLKPCTLRDWELHVHFHVHGSADELYGDGVAVWYTKHRLELGQYLNRHTHTFNSPISGTTQVSRYQKGKTNLDFTEARDNEWQWHQLGHMEICLSLQTDNHASTPPLSFLQAGCPFCCPNNSVKALEERGRKLSACTTQDYGELLNCGIIATFVFNHL